jgi:hypothetical protein
MDGAWRLSIWSMGGLLGRREMRTWSLWSCFVRVKWLYLDELRGRGVGYDLRTRWLLTMCIYDLRFKNASLR